jgi:ABC-type uncharacterized transport system substrate-binding protein
LSAQKADAVMVQTDALFKGATPPSCRWSSRTRSSCSINLKSANALGIAVPQLLLMRANEVVR